MNTISAPFRRRTRVHGFTLVELLTVIAVIGLLAAILIPTTSKVRHNARNAKTRAQFTQWAQAIEGFRQEYGYYPNFTRNAATPTKQIAINDSTSLFYEILSANDRTNKKITDPLANADGKEALEQNKKAIALYSFTPAELTLTAAGAVDKIVDPFSNEEIVVVIDTDLDGLLPKGDFVDLAPNTVFDSDKIVENNDPTVTYVRAGVAIYSRGRGEQLEDTVTSWR